MGDSPHPFFVSLISSGTKTLWRKVLEAQAKKRRLWKKQSVKGINGGCVKTKWSGRIFMKRRARLEGSRRPTNGMERKVRTLKKLVPNITESVGLDGLFRETADYILSLQMKVKVMQVMVDVLSSSDE